MRPSSLITINQAFARNVKVSWGWKAKKKGRSLTIRNEKLHTIYELVVIQDEKNSYDTLVRQEPNASVVIPWHRKNGSIYVGLMRHWRPVPSIWSWEVPRGFGDPKVTDEENAKRELREEWGQFGKLAKTGSFIANNGWDRSGHTVWAAEIDPTGQKKPMEEPTEHIKDRKWFRFPGGLPEIKCGITSSALFSFALYLGKQG